MNTVPEPVSVTVTVAAPPREAMCVLTEDIGAWWPPEYTFSGDEVATVVADMAEKHWYEISRDGRRFDWGDVLEHRDGIAVGFTWRVAPDRTQEPPERASRVRFEFEAVEKGQTRVTVTHDELRNHGVEAAAYRDGLASEQGWPLLMTRYSDRVGRLHPGNSSPISR